MLTNIERHRIIVRGIVQGVGFRPFVYGLARRLRLAGFVRNDSRGVTIEAEGPAPALDTFLAALRAEAPPLARIVAIEAEPIPPQGEAAFIIAHSKAGPQQRTLISPDVATCSDCLRELLDPADRRHHYPFINCTNCGPRLTIIQDLPYDRDKTTMRPFPMCPACRAEYDDPLNRRFHAQPNACPICGPAIWLSSSPFLRSPERADPSPGGRGTGGAGVFSQAAKRLAAGEILAVKGLGGYHLACDALHEAAVAQLRQRKHREAKPFALMAPDLETARQFCRVAPAEAELLESWRRPIVLLWRREDGWPVAPSVAPGQPTLGVMLPYTPLHHLLLCALAEIVGPQRPTLLVMTSGNLSDEPIAYHDDDAHDRLSLIADAFLTHNRAIHLRCDDSVVRVASPLAHSPTRPFTHSLILRRSRGYVPEPITLAGAFPLPLLACGGHLKNTFCLGQGHQAFVSHHIGDLENLETLTSFREGIEQFKRLFDIEPQAVAYDLHPEYLATKYARTLNLPHKIGVQHHHAHIASVLAEHGLAGPVIGIAADGTGYGPDGAIWGGEVLIAGLADFERVAHLAYVPLPGGEQAIRQPWRMAAVYLAQAYGEDFLSLEIPFVRQASPRSWRLLARMIERGLNTPPTSSLGRLFDAVAALVGRREEVAYEGQAALELEALAGPSERVYPFTIEGGAPSPAMIEGDAPATLNALPMIRAIVADIEQGIPPAEIAGAFHASLAELLATACVRVRAERGLSQVALSGGVFQNHRLLVELLTRLESLDFEVYLNRQVPPNDGGLSLGQAAVAAARLRDEFSS
jgi:hydrogenase maturation protein HypF